VPFQTQNAGDLGFKRVFLENPGGPTFQVLKFISRAPFSHAGLGMEKQRNFCPECAGILKYEASLKNYTCRSCGMTYTKERLEEARNRLHEENDERSKEDKKRRDVLKWWLNKKE